MTVHSSIVHAPIETGWSDWVKFSVIPPPSGNSTIQPPMVVNITPIILAPTANAKFLSRPPVPIKITPPKSLGVTSLDNQIASKNSQGIRPHRGLICSSAWLRGRLPPAISVGQCLETAKARP
ncbi:MAG: hypothetical protein OEV70_16355 [Nitrospirota bacterium]|nr:hypothetical protein [Nitrospirota bacterium]